MIDKDEISIKPKDVRKFGGVVAVTFGGDYVFQTTAAFPDELPLPPRPVEIEIDLANDMVVLGTTLPAEQRAHSAARMLERRAQAMAAIRAGWFPTRWRKLRLTPVKSGFLRMELPSSENGLLLPGWPGARK